MNSLLPEYVAPDCTIHEINLSRAILDASFSGGNNQGFGNEGNYDGGDGWN